MTELAVSKECLFCQSPIRPKIGQPHYIKALKYCNTQCAANARVAKAASAKERQCFCCRQTFPMNEENFLYETRRDKHGEKKRRCSGMCKGCNRTRSAERMSRPHNALRAATARKARIGKEMGLTEEQVTALLTEGDGTCEVCSRVVEPRTALNFDHDHETGKFRGLLCSPCNTALGMCRDNIRVLEELIKYLRKSGK